MGTMPMDTSPRQAWVVEDRGAMVQVVVAQGSSHGWVSHWQHRQDKLRWSLWVL